MRCEEVQDLASAWLDNELPDALAREVSAHEADCDACHAYITGLRQMSGHMRQLGREPAPPGLAERIRAALTEEAEAEQPSARPFPTRARWRGFTQQAASMAAVCLLSVFGTWAAVHRPDAVSSARHDVVAAHVRSLLQDSPIQVPSSDSHTVRPWFNGRVEFAPPVRDLTADGFPLAGGRLDYVDGHRVATLVYHHGPHTISVFVWPEGSGAAGPPSGISVVEGLNVLSWTKDGMIWWAVSDMEQGELKALRTLL